MSCCYEGPDNPELVLKLENGQEAPFPRWNDYDTNHLDYDVVGVRLSRGFFRDTAVTLILRPANEDG